MELLVGLIAFFILALAAVRWGADSRPTLYSHDPAIRGKSSHQDIRSRITRAEATQEEPTALPPPREPDTRAA